MTDLQDCKLIKFCNFNSPIIFLTSKNQGSYLSELIPLLGGKKGCRENRDCFRVKFTKTVTTARRSKDKELTLWRAADLSACLMCLLASVFLCKQTKTRTIVKAWEVHCQYYHKNAMQAIGKNRILSRVAYSAWVNELLHIFQVYWLHD